MSMPFYVAPEQVMKDRADYARKGIARGRSLAALELRRRHPPLRREPVEHAAQGRRDLRPHRLRRRRQVQRVRPAAEVRRPHRRPHRLPVQPRGRERQLAGQPVRPDPRQRLHPRDEAARGRDPRGRGRATTAADDQLFHILYDGTVMDEDRFSVLGGEAEAIAERLEAALRAGPRPRRRRRRRRRPPWPGPTARSAPTTSRSPCSSGPPPAAPSAASPTPSSPPLLPAARRAPPAPETPAEPTPSQRADLRTFRPDRPADPGEGWAMALLELRGVSKRYRQGSAGRRRPRRRRPRRRRRRVRRRRRPVGLRASRRCCTSPAGSTSPTPARLRSAAATSPRMSVGDRAALRRREVGFVFQFFHLLPTLTVAENVELPAAARRPARPGRRRAGAARAPRHRPSGRAPARRALRRRDAAHRHRPRPRHRAAAPPRRRAHRQPRLGHRRA